MFKMSNTSITVNMKHLLIAGLICFIVGIGAGRFLIPSKTTTITKTEYVDRVKTEVVEKKTDTSSNTSENKTNTLETKNNIVTTTKIHKKDGTIIETTIIDNTSHLAKSAESLVSNMTKTEASKDSTISTEHVVKSETMKTVEHKNTGIFDFGGGISMKGDVSDMMKNGLSSSFSVRDMGLSVEAKVWKFGFQAQGFGDGTVIGTVKLWTN